MEEIRKKCKLTDETILYFSVKKNLQVILESRNSLLKGERSERK